MGKPRTSEIRFRERVRSERECRSWSQARLAEALKDNGLPYVFPSTVAKIEAGDRAVRINEASALADIFGLSIDTLVGRPARGGDLAWAVSKLTSNAQKIAGEVSTLRLRLIAEAEDVHHYADDFHAVDIKEATYAAAAALEDARRSLAHLANQFPFPTG
jgi:transcriptional regulator with XRE-family HTH domain